MPAQLTGQPRLPTREDVPAVVSGELRCALTGRPLSPEEAYWAPRLVTTRQLVTTIAHALFTAPGSLGPLLLGEQPNVPYAPEARQQLANRRSAEQLKLLALLLVAAAILIVPIVFLVS